MLLFSGRGFGKAALIAASVAAIGLSEGHAQSEESVKVRLEKAYQLTARFDYEGAIEQYKAVKSSVNATDAERDAASMSIIRAYLTLKKYDEAEAAATAFIQSNASTYQPATVAQVRSARMSLAEAKIGRNKDEEAIAIYREIIKNDPASAKPWLARGPLIDLLLRRGKIDEAVAAYEDLLCSKVTSLSPETLKAFRRLALENAKDPVRGPAIVLVCRKAITANPSDLRRSEALQQTIAEIYLMREEYDKAIMEAKVLMHATGSKEGMEGAVNIVMMSFKVKDGNLSRVNQLIQFQKVGRAGVDKKPGTEDDIENPLAAVSIRYSSDESRLFENALVKANRDWSGRLDRGNLYLFWSKPKEALEELKIAYAIAPLEQATIQKITDRILVALVEASGDPTLSDEYLRFQRSGPGETKPGGPDVTTNPIDLVLNSK